jgi:hypothetical protein
MSKVKIWRGVAILACLVATTAIAAASAAAKPAPAFAPMTGTYDGTAVVQGKNNPQGAIVSKKGSTYSVLLSVNAPAECLDTALGVPVPIAVSYEVEVPLHGTALSYKGKGTDQSGQIGNKYVATTVTGHFEGTEALKVRVTTKIAPEGSNSESTSCTVPPVSVKLKHS